MTLPRPGSGGLTARSDRPLERTIEPASNWPAFAVRWEKLAEGSDCSIFLSPLWIETWIDTFGDVLDISLLSLRAQGLDVGACLVVNTAPSITQPLRKVSLNASGEPASDTIYVELNDVLCRPGWQGETASALAEYLMDQSWDELRLDGFCTGIAYDVLKMQFAEFETEESWQASYYVDLAALRKAGIPYSKALGPGRGKYVQRKLGYHSQVGELKVDAASTAEEAVSMLDELALLNSRRFESLGQRGIWNSSRFAAFHRTFIRKGFALGQIQMLRVSAGSETVGLLYNLVHRNKAYFYQCGYNYSGDKRMSPGVVTLALAVDYCREAGLDEFDFLAGDSAYKEWMSTGARRLAWTRFRRRGPRVWMYNRLRSLKHRIAS
jgi:Acetyltransferase (GNAT) domain